MPRANRHFLPNHVWHITHRCHKKEFLLKFVRDRRRWLHWLFEARKRYGLSVLNYMVTSNHIHLLVRAGVVTHPAQWAESGYWEVQNPPKRYRVIDVQALIELVGLRELEQHQLARANWVDAALDRGLEGRDSAWTEGLAVGSEHFVEGIKQALGMKGRYREVTEGGDTHMLREPPAAYNRRFGHEISLLSAINGVFWEQS